MLKIISLSAVAALALAVTVTSQPAFARDGGAVAAGVIGGLAAGAIIGSQFNRVITAARIIMMSRVINRSIANATPSGNRLKTGTETSVRGAFASAIDVLARS